MGFQRASLCGRPFEARVAFIFQNYSNSFVKARLEARGIKALKKQTVFSPKMTGFWASYSNLLINDGLPTGFSLWKTICSPCCVYFQIYCNSFVKARPEARDIKALKRQIAWPPNDGLLGFLFKPIVLHWASLCGRPFEARVAFIFEIYCSSFVKGRPESRGSKALKKENDAWFGPKITGFWASYSNLLFHFGLPTGFSLWKTI